MLYRPSCAECSACLSARIRVADFAPSRSQRRVRNRNDRLTRRAMSPWATEEQFTLFRDYLDSRHATGGMADMDLFEFAAMVEETPVRTRLIEYTDPDAHDDVYDGLAAVCLTDILEDGLSMVYSFFAPERQKHSLGTHLILDHIATAREMGLPYVYLGYWVPGSPKMDYKSKFKGLEIYRKGAWQDIGDPQNYSADTHPLAVAPSAEQVAQISLPGSSRV